MKLNVFPQKYRFDNVRVSNRSGEPSLVFTATTVVTPVPDWDPSCIEPFIEGAVPEQATSKHLVWLFFTPIGCHEAPLHCQV